MNRSRKWVRLIPLAALSTLGCSSGKSQDDQGSPGAASLDTSSTASCQAGAALTGTPYDVTKSRFAFGSAPVSMDAGSLVRFVGADGVVAIFANGSELGGINAGAREEGLPDWSSDDTALTTHAEQYFESMGVAACQIAGSGIDGSGGGGGGPDGSFFVTATSRTVVLNRGVDGIRVGESLASARFDSEDQTTSEGFYWPEVPAATVTDARSFRDRLADPAALAAYKALLPGDAQGDGEVVIHHTSSASTQPFQTAATYDVLQSSGPLGLPAELSFDENGNLIATGW